MKHVRPPRPPSRDPRPLACLALLFAACSKAPAASAPPPPAVVAAEVLVADLPEFSEYVGQTDATSSIEVRARVEGYVRKVSYGEGTLVKQDELLFEIEKEPLEQRLKRARAGLADAQATRTKAEQDIARYKPLVEQRAIPRQDLENALAAKLRADAAVDAADSDVRRAELDLGYAEVRAPIAGLIGDSQADLGDLVGGPGSKALATISPIDPIGFDCYVSEVEYLDARAANPEGAVREMPVRLLLANGTEHPATGHFSYAARSVDARTGTLRVRAEFPNPAGVLRPGQFGRIRVLKNIRKDALLVPQRAVQEIQGTYNVFTVSAEGKAAFTRVKVGARVGPLWLVESGLKRGERVIVEGLIKVRDGVPVQASPTRIDDAPVAELRKLVPAKG